MLAEERVDNRYEIYLYLQVREIKLHKQKEQGMINFFVYCF